MTSVVLDEGVRAGTNVMAGLKQRHVDSRPFFPPVSSFPMFESRAEANPVAVPGGPARASTCRAVTT